MSCPFAKSDSPTDAKPGEFTYSNYLKLDRLLNSNFPKSKPVAHHEHLFISVHHAFEIWFKQILIELDLVLKVMKMNPIPETEMLRILRALNRINKIFGVIVQQFDILETMTPLDFIEFRGFLGSASGFQSLQWRVLENKMGLQKAKRVMYGGKEYDEALPEEEQAMLTQALGENRSLFGEVEAWLARTPFTKPLGASGRYNWWSNFAESVEAWLDSKTVEIKRQSFTENQQKERIKSHVTTLREKFSTILDPEKFEEERKKGKFRFSHEAYKAAIMILTNREQPLFQIPFQFLQAIMDLDAKMTQWRQRHAEMVNRMVGTKIGTGGSSGYYYLIATAARHRIFNDLFHTSTYMIPPKFLPKLPHQVTSLLQSPSIQAKKPSSSFANPMSPFKGGHLDDSSFEKQFAVAAGEDTKTITPSERD